MGWYEDWGAQIGAGSPTFQPEEDLELKPPPFNPMAAGKALFKGGLEALTIPGQFINEMVGKGLHLAGSPSDAPLSEQAAAAFVAPEDDDSGFTQYAKAVARPVVRTGYQMLTDPLTYGGLSVLNKLGKSGNLLHKLIGYGFTGTMGAHGVEAAKAAAETVEKEGFSPQAVEQAIESLIGLGFAAPGVLGAGREVNRLRPSVRAAEARAKAEAELGQAHDIAAEMNQLRMKGMPGIEQPQTPEAARAMIEAYSASPDMAALTPETEVVVQRYANQMLGIANRLVAARARPEFGVGGEQFRGPQRVELAGEVNPVDGMPWQEGVKAEVSPDGSTIFLSPYGRAWALHAPDAAGVQANLADLMAHEVMHPAASAGMPAARNQLRPATPEERAAFGDDFVTDEAPGAIEAPGHAVTGTWADDRVVDYKMRQGEYLLGQALKRHPQLQRFSQEVQQSGVLGQGRPALAESATAGTYAPDVADLTAQLGMAPRANIMDVASAPSAMRPAFAAGGKSLGSVFRNARDPRLKEALEADKARKDVAEAEAGVAQARAGLAAAQPRGPEARALELASQATAAADPVGRALVERQQQLAQLGLVDQVVQRMRAMPMLGALLGRRQPAPAAAPAAPEILPGIRLGEDMRGRTRGNAFYHGKTGIDRLQTTLERVKADPTLRASGVVETQLGMPRGWLRKFESDYINTVRGMKDIPPELQQHKARIDELKKIFGERSRAYMPDRMQRDPNAVARAEAASEARVKGKPGPSGLERNIAQMDQHAKVAKALNEAKGLAEALNKAQTPKDIASYVGKLRQLLGTIPRSKLADQEQIRAYDDYHTRAMDHLAKLAGMAKPSAPAPAPGGGMLPVRPGARRVGKAAGGKSLKQVFEEWRAKRKEAEERPKPKGPKVAEEAYEAPKWAKARYAARSVLERVARYYRDEPLTPETKEKLKMAGLPQPSRAVPAFRPGYSLLSDAALAAMRRAGEVPKAVKKLGKAMSTEGFKAWWSKKRAEFFAKGSGTGEKGEPTGRLAEDVAKAKEKAIKGLQTYWEKVSAGERRAPGARIEDVEKGVHPRDLKKAIDWAKEKGNLRDYPDWLLEEAARESYARTRRPEALAKTGPLQEVEYEAPKAGEAPKEYKGLLKVKSPEIHIGAKALAPVKHLTEYFRAPEWGKTKEGKESADSAAWGKLFGTEGETTSRGVKLEGKPGFFQTEQKFTLDQIDRAGFSKPTAARLRKALIAVMRRLEQGRIPKEINLEGYQIKNNPEAVAAALFGRIADRIVSEAATGKGPWRRRTPGPLVREGERVSAEGLTKGLKMPALKGALLREVPGSAPHGSRTSKFEHYRRWATTEEAQKRGGQEFVEEPLEGKAKATETALRRLGFRILKKGEKAPEGDLTVITPERAEEIFDQHNTGSVTSESKRKHFSPYDIATNYAKQLRDDLGPIIRRAKWARATKEGKSVATPPEVLKAGRDYDRYNALLKLDEAKLKEAAAKYFDKRAPEVAAAVRAGTYSRAQLLNMIPKGMSVQRSLVEGLRTDFNQVQKVWENVNNHTKELSHLVDEKGQPFGQDLAEGQEVTVQMRNRLGTAIQGKRLQTGVLKRLKIGSYFEYPEFQAAGGKVSRSKIPDLLDLLGTKRAFPTGGRRGGLHEGLEETQAAEAGLTEGSLKMRGLEGVTEGTRIAPEGTPEALKLELQEAAEAKAAAAEEGGPSVTILDPTLAKDLKKLRTLVGSKVGMGSYTGAKQEREAPLIVRGQRGIRPPRISTGEPSTRLSPPPEGPAPREIVKKRYPMAEKPPSGLWATTPKSRAAKGITAPRGPLSPEELAAARAEALKVRPLPFSPKGRRVGKAAGGSKRKVYTLGSLPRELETSVNTPRSALPKETKGEAVARDAIHTVGKWMNITRPMLTAVDLSNYFRQTWQLTSDQIVRDFSKVFSKKYRGEDTSFYKNLRDGIRAFRSKDVHDALTKALEADEWYIAGREKGLNFASAEHPNEAYLGKEAMEKVAKVTGLTKASGLVDASQRAFEYAQNKAMRDGFKHYIEALEAYKAAKEPGSRLTEDEIMDAVRHINNAASRGKVTSSKELNEVANYVLYSAQMNASRLRMLFSAGGTLNASSRASRYVAGTQTLRAIAGAAAVTGVVYSVGKLAAPFIGQEPELEADPRSTDWGKVRWGNTTFDAWGGNQQFLRAAVQSLTGQQKERSTGLPRDRKLGDTLSTFFRSKLAPGASTAWNILDKRTLSGESTDVLSLDAPNRAGAAATLIKELIVPMSVQDTIDLWRENPRLSWLIPLMLMGEGLGAGAGAKEKWLEDRDLAGIIMGKPGVTRQLDRANALELRRLGVTPPKLSGRVTLPGKDPYGRANYYNLNLAEKQEFEAEYMPLVTRLLNEFINSETYRNLPDAKKQKRLYKYVHKLNVTYGAAKKAKKKFREAWRAKKLEPSNRVLALEEESE